METGDADGKSSEEDLFVPVRKTSAQKAAKPRSVPGHHRHAKTHQQLPTLPSLRKDENLTRKVERELAKLTLADSEDSESGSSSDDRGARSLRKGKQHESLHRLTRKGKLISGRSLTPTSKVINPQMWPHSELNLSFVASSKTYDDLQVDEFVAGYATILR